MRKATRSHIIFQKLNALFFVLALLWLTVSTPFIMANQFSQDQLTSIESPIDNGGEEETANPLNSNSEEKPHNCNNLLEEYIHHSASVIAFNYIALSHAIGLDGDSYKAYHGELLVPPPNRA
ncbi:hypothetical protein [Sediminibacterium sp.]|uniref:hypothetical protein n=1 Tax=Sediminibacterium sp. TaxID=1917865 RepID=UPI00273771CF|nr:hypothetical protein [Sediminibacterium sp.]MDP3394577.1 hypothetical protein [Sediminibacterium sp.]MDP3568412.1 hypothetical protein [Sediminibacterium sp.]